MMGKLLPQRFTTATGLARGSATLIAQVLANDEASEPTRIRKTRVLCVSGPDRRRSVHGERFMF